MTPAVRRALATVEIVPLLVASAVIGLALCLWLLVVVQGAALRRWLRS